MYLHASLQPISNPLKKIYTPHNKPDNGLVLLMKHQLNNQPMEDTDKTDEMSNEISEDEDLMHREIFQGDADLLYLHHYLSEVYRKG